MERKFRYEEPTQVNFLDFDADDGNTWLGGIAFGTNIICGCCGGVFEIADLYADWDELKENYPGIEAPIRDHAEWTDISAELAENFG